MGLFSSSRSSTTHQTTTNVQNLNLQDISDAIVVAESEGVNIQTTDHGAISAAEAIATRGIDAVRDVSEHAISSQYETSDRALDFGEAAISDIRGAFSELLGANQATVGANIQGLTALARDTSQTADDRLVKVVGIAIGGVVVIFVAQWLMQRFGGASG